MATYYFRNTGNVNWGVATNWSLTDGGGATGAIPTVADDAYFTSNSGNCTVNASARVCKSLVFSGVGAGNYAGTITMTNAITVSGNVTLSSTMTIAGTAGLTVNALSTLRSNGKTWPNSISLTTAATYTLADNWDITGTLTISGAVTFSGAFNITTVTLSITTNGTVTLSGNITASGLVTLGNTLLSGVITTINGVGFTIFCQNSLTLAAFTSGANRVAGTAKIEVNSGTITSSSLVTLTSNLDLNGNITFASGGTFNYGQGTLTYVSGIITTTGSTLNISLNLTTTLNTSSVVWSNINISGSSAPIISLSSNLNVVNFTLSASSSTNTINNNNVYIFGNLSVTSTGNLVGTSNIILNGKGTWSHATTGQLRNNLTINTADTLTVSGTINYNTGTLTYVSGNVITKNSILLVSLATTFINCNRLFFETVTITSGITITMNEFFGGKPTKKPIIQASSTTNYIVQFQDSFEKLCKFVDIRNCTLSKRGQLLSLTDVRRKGTNLGIRYINQSPNGVPKNIKFANEETYLANSLVSDPTKN